MDNKSRSDFFYVVFCYKMIYLYVFPCLILYASQILQFHNSLVVIIICYWSLFHLTFTETTTVTLSVVFLFLQLLLSGDIETNPGPHSYKDCPACGKAVHVKSKSCLSCGFLSKKIKGISRTWRSSVESSPSGSNNITNIPVTVSATNPAISQSGTTCILGWY